MFENNDVLLGFNVRAKGIHKLGIKGDKIRLTHHLLCLFHRVRSQQEVEPDPNPDELREIEALAYDIYNWSDLFTKVDGRLRIIL